MLGFVIAGLVGVAFAAVAAVPAGAFIIGKASLARRSVFLPPPYNTRVVDGSPIAHSDLVKLMDKFRLEWQVSFGRDATKVLGRTVIEWVDKWPYFDDKGDQINGELNADNWIVVPINPENPRNAVEVLVHEWIHASSKRFFKHYGQHPGGPWTESEYNRIEIEVVKFSRTLPVQYVAAK